MAEPDSPGLSPESEKFVESIVKYYVWWQPKAGS